MTQTPTPQDLLRDVSGIAPSVAAEAQPMVDEHLFTLPTQTFTVETTLKVPGAEAMNGEVTLKMPSVGDEMRIERVTAALGDRQLAEVIATLGVCIVKAPVAWYSIPKGATTPALHLERLPDLEALADLYLRFNQWRRSFR